MNENSKEPPSFLSKDIKLDGHIESNGTVLISGQVTGNVQAKSLTLETTGSIYGNIKAHETELMGTQKGNISSNRLSILTGSKLRGNINCKELIVEHGSDISGKINTSKKN
tara:strand:- start:1063 stop:1395 length:333 start_codon:yes stop_codon:yes gene_type:complete